MVDGKALPNIPFDVGESYAGLVPISDNEDEVTKLFFWFFPSTNPTPSDEIMVWCPFSRLLASYHARITDRSQ